MLMSDGALISVQRDQLQAQNSCPKLAEHLTTCCMRSGGAGITAQGAFPPSCTRHSAVFRRPVVPHCTGVTRCGVTGKGTRAFQVWSLDYAYPQNQNEGKGMPRHRERQLSCRQWRGKAQTWLKNKAKYAL